MSDTFTPPPPSAPPAPAPAPANEAVINPNPVNSPNPIGSQAPDKPEGAPRPTARESIQKAFDRANNPAPKPARPANTQQPQAKPAEARMGHNQPPEPTEGLDLKRRPSDQPRGERGQFAPRQEGRVRTEGSPGHDDRTPQGQTQNKPQSPSQPAQSSPNSPYALPPSRMSDVAKRDWANAPDSVRGEVHRMQAEFVNAYNKFKENHEAFKPIKKYHEMARSHGTTLDRALSHYVNMEQKLRADPIGGLDVIVNNLNLQGQNGQRLGLRDLAYYILNQTPEQLRQVQQGNAQNAAAHQIGSLHQEIAGLKNSLNQMHTQQQFTYTRSEIDKFADSHPRLDELGTAIEAEIKLGFDLPTAYRRAELLYPATHAAQTRDPSAQTRTVDRSISGAPAAGPANGAARRRDPSPTARAAVQNAIRRTMNGAP